MSIFEWSCLWFCPQRGECSAWVYKQMTYCDLVLNLHR